MKRLSWLLLAAALNVSAADTPEPQKMRTVINGREMTEQQKEAFRLTYGVPPLAGDFWYDSRSGLWGVRGREAFGILRPGHDYGPLAPNASAGSTGVFINGRQINMAEAMYIRNLLGSVIPGRWWLDGSSGYFGLEGNSIPAGNLYAAARAAQARSGGGGTNYYNDGMGTRVAVSSGCATGTTGTGSSRTSFIVGCN